MPTTTKFTASTIGVPQHGTYWCIPASIENLLRSEGITNITQEQIVYAFLLIHGPRTGIFNGVPTPIASAPKYAILEGFRCPELPNASFQTFAPVTNSLLQKLGHSIRLDYKENIASNADYVKEILDVLGHDKPVLISAKSSGAWHITIVYDCDGTNIRSYDPGQDEHIPEIVSHYTFSHDLLFVK
jgi:hypothetical protein